MSQKPLSSRQLTALRLERTKLQSRLDQYTGYCRGTRQTPIKIPLNLPEAIFEIEQRINKINSLLKPTQKKLIFNKKVQIIPETMFHTPKTPENLNSDSNNTFGMSATAPPFNPYNTIDPSLNPKNIDTSKFQKASDDDAQDNAKSLDSNKTTSQSILQNPELLEKRNNSPKTLYEEQIKRLENELRQYRSREKNQEMSYREHIDRLTQDMKLKDLAIQKAQSAVENMKKHNDQSENTQSMGNSKYTGTIPKQLNFVPDDISDEYHPFSPLIGKSKKNQRQFFDDSDDEFSNNHHNQYKRLTEDHHSSNFRNNSDNQNIETNSSIRRNLFHQDLPRLDNTHRHNNFPRIPPINQRHDTTSLTENNCRKTFLRQLQTIPVFKGENRDSLMTFLDVGDTLNAFVQNHSEYCEFMMQVCLQLRGSAKSCISNNADWDTIKSNLLKQFRYLSNVDITNSKIENLKQDKNESLQKYADRSRKLFDEKNQLYFDLPQELRHEHDRCIRKAFARGIANTTLRERVLLRGANSLEEAICFALEFEHENDNTVHKSELFCKFCKNSGHRQNECRKKEQSNTQIGQFVSALQSLGLGNKSNNNNRNFKGNKSGQNWNNNNNGFRNNNNNDSNNNNGYSQNNSNRPNPNNNNRNNNYNNNGPNRNYNNGSNNNRNPNNNFNHVSNQNSNNNSGKSQQNLANNQFWRFSEN